MTEYTPEGGGTPLSFKKVQDPAQFERAPAPTQPVRDNGGPSLDFEAAPRVPLPRVTTPDPRTLRTSPLAPPPPPAPPQPPFEAPPPGRAPAFEAVPASVGVAQQRLSTPTIGVRPGQVGMAGPVNPGGSGWNIRPREGAFVPNRGPAATAEGVSWETRDLPGANRDRSAWSVPAAPRSRKLSGRKFLGIALSLILVAVLGFAGYEWLTGRAHPAHTISTPTAVGALTPIHTAATVALTQQMQRSMQQYGATRVVSGVYGDAGRPTLVVLLAQGSNIETTTTQFFTDFAAGLKTQGVIVDTTEITTTMANGSDFMCSPASAPAPVSAVSVCGWDDGDTVGVVMDFSGQPVTATLRNAEATRSAGERLTSTT